MVNKGVDPLGGGSTLFVFRRSPAHPSLFHALSPGAGVCGVHRNTVMSIPRKGLTMAVDLPNLIWLTNETDVLAQLPHYVYNMHDTHSFHEWLRGRALPAIPWLDGETRDVGRRVLILLAPRNTVDHGALRPPDSNWYPSFAAEYLNPDEFFGYAVWKRNYDLVCGTDWPLPN